MSYATIDAYLARQNAFYNFCNDVAESYVEEYGDNPYKGDDLDEHIIEWLSYECYGMMTAHAEDLINSYGMTKAIKQYHDAVMERIDNHDLYAHALLHDIAGECVIGRVKGILKNNQSSS